MTIKTWFHRVPNLFTTAQKYEAMQEELDELRAENEALKAELVVFRELMEDYRDAEVTLKAQLAALEAQKPVAWRTKESKEKNLDDWFYASNPTSVKVHRQWVWFPLYLAAGAKP